MRQRIAALLDELGRWVVDYGWADPWGYATWVELPEVDEQPDDPAKPARVLVPTG